MPYAIGIDLGGSSVKTIAVTRDGETLARANHDFDPKAAMNWAEKIRQITEAIQAERGEPASWIGVSAPGLAAPDQRSIAHMPGRLQGLERLDWTSYLQTPRPVTVLNDAHAALLGESWLGAAKGFRNVIMLTLGTGVGGAAMVDGHLLRGHIGRAGHLGHVSLDINGPADVCGTPGSLEVAIGNCTIEERTRGRFKSTLDLVAAHLAADAEASGYWNRSVRTLACAVVSFINLFDPEAVIIGGGIARCGAALFDPLQHYVAEMEWRPGGRAAKILPATLGELAGAYGASKNAMG
jgi:glucokinase